MPTPPPRGKELFTAYVQSPLQLASSPRATLPPGGKCRAGADPLFSQWWACSWWAFYIGFSALSLIWLFGYGTIVVGQWRCLMGAPERHGCKWLMFACMTGLLMGPALNVAAGATGLTKGPDYRRGPAGFTQVRFTATANQMQMASGVLGFSSLLFFMLFLRAVARCFGDTARIAHVAAYLLLVGLLTSASMYLVYAEPLLLWQPRVLLGLGAAWAISFIWYLCLIGSMRTCISRGLAEIRSPLDAAE